MGLLDKSTHKALVYFFPIFMIDYYLIMRGINLNVILGLPFISIFYLYGIVKIITPSKVTIYILWQIWFVYNILSVICYLFNGVPFSCYIWALRSTIFPFLFVTMGYKFDDLNINKNYMIACGFCFIVGFYLYFVGPTYYTTFLREVREATWYMKTSSDTTADQLLEVTRFCSFFTTSYAISFFSIPALTFSLHFIVYEKISPINKYLNYIICVVCFVAAVLCQQRVAMAAAFCITLYYSVFAFRQGNKKLLKVFILFFIVSIIVLAYLGTSSRFEAISNIITERIENFSISDAYSERTGQRESFNRMTDWSFLFGLGMGSCGHGVTQLGISGINDGELVKMFYEYGILGFSLFLAIMFYTIKEGFKKIKYVRPDLVIVFFYLVACTGSSALSMPFYSIMFWFCVGRIWNKKYIATMRNLVNNNQL